MILSSTKRIFMGWILLSVMGLLCFAKASHVHDIELEHHCDNHCSDNMYDDGVFDSKCDFCDFYFVSKDFEALHIAFEPSSFNFEYTILCEQEVNLFFAPNVSLRAPPIA